MTADDGARSTKRRFGIALARAFGGAIFFSLPLLMTMETWWLGFYMNRLKLALLTVVTFPVLVGLSSFSGFEETETLADDVVDALVAIGVGLVASAAILFILNILRLDMPFHEIVGKVTLLAGPASFGAILAASELGGRGRGRRERERKAAAGYWSELFFMLAGAVFFAANLAPTEEMILIAFKATYVHGIALALATLVMMHAFVYGVEFHGTPTTPPDTPWWSLFLRFTLVGYALALAISTYALWTFDRFGGGAAVDVLMIVVLAFPAGLGASVARLLL